MARALRPEHEQWIVSRSEVRTEIQVTLAVMYKGLETREGMNFYFRKSDGRLRMVSAGVPLDFSRPFGKIVSRERAVNAAWDAYYRFRPFPSARVASVELVLGPLNSQYGAVHELTAEELDQASRFVAVPFFIVTLSKGFSQAGQIVFVDGETGRPKVLVETSGPLGGGEPPKPDTLIGREALDVVLAGKKHQITLQKDAKPKQAHPTGLKIAAVEIADAKYIGCLDAEKNTLWLGGDKAWYPYTLSETAKKDAERALFKGKPFGKKAD